MENRQIWLKPKPSHIDENFEDFLDYLKTTTSSSDTLYIESLRLLKERVALLMEERTAAPIYRQNKDPEALKFNIRLCGAWLLAVKDAGTQDRKQVLLTMINNLIHLSLQSKVAALNNFTYAYKNASALLQMAISLVTHDMPQTLSFSWSDLTGFSLDIFVMKFLKLNFTTSTEGLYEGKGLMTAAQGKITLTTYSKQLYDKKYLQKGIVETPLLPEYGVTMSTDKNLQIKESQKEDIEVLEEFVNDIPQCMKAVKKATPSKCLRHYNDGDYVPVEVTEVSLQSIEMRTIDPHFSTVTGRLVFDQNLKIFSKIYPAEVWCKVLKTGDRLNVHVKPSDGTFSITDLFIDYIRDNVDESDVFDAHNRRVPGSWLNLREFWTNAGFMVYVDLTEEENEQLEESEGYAGVEITRFGTGLYSGCLYGRICDFEVEQLNISRDETCPAMIRRFIEEHSQSDLEHLSKKHNLSPTLDAYMLYISKIGEEWFGETYWKYVTLKPVSEHNVVSIIIEPYPYDIVYLKDRTTYLRKNNASAPITDESTIEDIRRRRLENLRKTDDKTIILKDAIQKERKVRLVRYKSSNSGTIQNRTVEAFHMDSNEYVHCYEAEHDKVKVFRISRAEKVVMLDEPWEHKSRHQKLKMDPFHMSGGTAIDVKLRLKLEAKNAIEELYPDLSSCIKPYDSSTWTLQTFTYNLYPLTMFYLSHAPYVEIVNVAGLKEAVKEYVSRYLKID